MLANTHAKIADIIYNLLDDTKKSFLDYNSFVNGSVAPDLDKRYVDLDHDFNGSIDVVIDLLYRCLNHKYESDDLGYNLGIISHFISDYCSSYHSNQKNRRSGFVKHLLYELQIDEIIRDFIPDIIETNYFNRLRYVQNDLQKFIQTDMQLKEDPYKDIAYAITLNYKLINLVLDEYQKYYKK